MRASDLIVETASAFNSNRVRSLLTVLGVVIGIGAVIAMTAIIGGMKTALVGEMGLSQARLVNIYSFYGSGMRAADVQEMSDELSSSFEFITPTVFGTADIVSTTEKGSGSLQGVYPEYETAMGLKFSQGRFITQTEVDTGALVVVLDQPGVKTLFGSTDEQVVGKTVRINGAEYQIVGVVETEQTGYDSGSVNAYLPFSTMTQRIATGATVSQALGMALEEVDPETAANAAKSWMIKRYQIPEDEQEDAMYVYTMKSIIDQLDSLMASFQTLMTVVASISLLVGGIGIMNMMLTNVTERIREIGLRKALGARRRDITRQFLLESICLTLAGGVFGILLGLGGAYALAGLAGDAFGLTTGATITPTIGPDTVALVAGICVFIGVAFGYYPARRAAKLDPVESLHYQ